VFLLCLPNTAQAREFVLQAVLNKNTSYCFSWATS